MSVKFYKKYLTVIAGLGGLLYGIDLGVIAAALPYINCSSNYTSAEIGLIVGMVMWGTVISSLFAGQLSEWFGRKKIMILSAFIFSISIPICCASGMFPGGNFIILCIGRILQGVAGGLIGVVVPMYIAECFDAKNRGRGTAFFQLILTFGLVCAALVGLIVTNFVGSAYTPEAGQTIPAETLASWTSAWQIIFWCSAIPGVIMFIGCFWLKESPRWLFKKGFEKEALNSLAANNGMENAKKILIELKEAECVKDVHKAAVKDSFKDALLKKKYILPFLLTVLVLTLNQCTGINTVLNYSVTIFQKTGLEGELANWSDLTIKLVNFAVTIIAVMLVDKKGRKFLLRIGTGGIVIGEIGVALMMFMMDSGFIEVNFTSGIITACCFYLFVAGFAFGPGVCVWLVLTELMPTRIRANGMAIAMIFNQAVSAMIASIFPVWSDACGMFAVFGILAMCSVVYFLVASFIIPETKGKSLEEIAEFFK